MKYYAHFGHKDFILCLGYKAQRHQGLFSRVRRIRFQRFCILTGRQKLDFMQRDIDDWKITFVDTGLRSTIADRLRLVEPYLNGEEMFLANYSDGLTDFHLPADDRGIFASATATPRFFPCSRAPAVWIPSTLNDDGYVHAIKCMKDTNIWVNGGYFVLRKEVFRYINPGEELVYEPFQRLIAEGKVWSHRYEGFWQCMDTFRDKQILDELEAAGKPPWCLWKNGQAAPRVVA